MDSKQEFYYISRHPQAQLPPPSPLLLPLSFWLTKLADYIKPVLVPRCRLMRAHTNREKVLKFVGCYHGHADSFLVQAGSGVATLGLPDSPGVPAASTGSLPPTPLGHCTHILFTKEFPELSPAMSL